MLKVVKEGDNLNTSHIKVNLLTIAPTALYYWYLNTSHIKVNLDYLQIYICLAWNLNTSHIKVNHTESGSYTVTIPFKYISY